MYTKCQNLNRKAVKTSSDSDTPAKRRKMDKSHHEYPSCVVEIEDDTSHQRNLDALMQEVSKPNSRSDVLKDLMKRTYGRRRRWILEEERLVSTICAEYPPLKKAPYVSFFLIGLHNDCVQSGESSGTSDQTLASLK